MNLLPISRGYFSGPNERYQIKKSFLQSSKDNVDVATDMYRPEFKKGDQVQVEVIFFGPLGASVDIVAHNTHDPDNCIPNDEPALGRGMVLQREIDYFRRGRGGIDVVKYEILPAYIENVYEKVLDDGSVEERIDISLRPPGGKAKAQELGEQILERLKESDGILDVGDKSTPEEINEYFPGSSKSAFKKAFSDFTHAACRLSGEMIGTSRCPKLGRSIPERLRYRRHKSRVQIEPTNLSFRLAFSFDYC